MYATSLVTNAKTVVDVDIEDLVYRRPRFQITEQEKVVMAAYQQLSAQGFTFLGFSIVDNDRITWSGVHPDGHDVYGDWPYPVDTPAT